jgi:hypothetical protein
MERNGEYTVNAVGLRGNHGLDHMVHDQVRDTALREGMISLDFEKVHYDGTHPCLRGSAYSTN